MYYYCEVTSNQVKLLNIQIQQYRKVFYIQLLQQLTRNNQLSLLCSLQAVIGCSINKDVPDNSETRAQRNVNKKRLARLENIFPWQRLIGFSKSTLLYSSLFYCPVDIQGTAREYIVGKRILNYKGLQKEMNLNCSICSYLNLYQYQSGE